MVSSDPLNPLVNGSFEDNGGSFHGWNIKELSRASNPQQLLAIAGSTLGGAGIQYPTAGQFQAGNWFLNYFDSEPTDGSWAAVHDFNGDDQGTLSSTLVNRRELYQDLTLPAGTTTLEFDYRAAWELYRFGATQPRTFSVEIQPAGGGAPLLSEIILNATNGGPPADPGPVGTGFEEDTDNPTGFVTSYPDGIADLSAYGGQNVRLLFVWNVPEPATGFAFFQLDNVRLNFTLIPLTDIAIISVSAPASVTVGDTPTVMVTVNNVGNQDVTNLSVSLAPTAGGGSVTNSPQVIALTAGTNTTLNFTWDTGGATIQDHTLTATHDLLPDDNNTNDSAMALVTVTAVPVTDIAITSVTAPGSVTVGDTPTVMVTVGNVGNQDVTNLGVSLGATAGSVSPTQTIALTAGTSTTLNFTWDTGGATIQDHTLTATHDRLPDDNDTNDSAMATVTVNGTPPPPPMVDNLTNADFSTVQGTIVGSHVDTHVQDDSYEALTETRQGKRKKVRSSLNHTWTANVLAGSSYLFKLDAYHTPNSEGDNFVVSYSTDNSTFTDMLTVTKTADDDVEQTFLFPGDVSGTLYIRVVDTNNSQGNGGLDTFFVDSMAVTTVTGGTDILPPGAPAGLNAIGSEGNVALDWDDNTEPDLDGYRVFRSTTSGAGYAPIGPALIGVSDFQDTTVVNGTTYFYLVTAVDTTGNEGAASAEASATPDVAGSAPSVHVASVVASSVRQKGNRRRGRAVAVIVDNLGSPVGSFTVTGTFTGDFNQSQSDVTNGSGSAVIDTSNTIKGNVNFTFCVDDVTGGLPYQAGDNVVTCDSL